MKNFIKLIKQIYEENYTKVLTKIITNKIPVAFLSLAPIVQAVETVKDFRTQGLNVTNLVVTDDTPPPANLDFNVVNITAAAQIFPQPEYVFVMKSVDAAFAKKFMGNFKILLPYTIRGKNTDEVYKIFMTHLSELQEIYGSLVDEQSRKTFCGYWLGRITNQLGKIVYFNSAHYLVHGFIPERGAVVIEAGTFDGGTATVLSEMGYNVYTFEPDRISYQRSLQVAEEKNFIVENLGLGSYKHTANYDAKGTNSNKLSGKGSETVDVTTIDAYVREKNLTRVDFIKMDVEGAELDILKGAATTIARFKPILAISAYHKINDFWTLMNFVKSVRPDYKFAMRQSYETPEEEPAHLTAEGIFKGANLEFLISLGLEPDDRNFNECVLFAR